MKQRLYVLMGVAGSGKSSIGAGVADLIGGTYIDGDDFHPQSNIDKMASGEPLKDDDRWPWLKIVSTELARINGIGLVGCSALKKAYREVITANAGEPVKFIYLNGTKELIGERMAARQGHFMPAKLLESQFATLEEPNKTENAISVDISGQEREIITHIADVIREDWEKKNGK
ncbi:gluconokinase [Ahrensia kielensis]|uniref:gluconokinase n=1 Tax=Ahrensia kielensis TaxID=76980 RepID=UPI000381AADB|nr:gluconokinase [Ahrensia kielensis]